MFDYFYGQSGEMFSYFRVPKILFRDIKFKDLSTDAKTLYGILLDRMGLSVKNGWLDEQGRVYIIFPVQEVMDALGCADNKATKLFRELEKFGLIERKRRGLGKPNLIYVKNFADPRFRNREKNGSGAADSAQQETAKSRGNKTEWNKTEGSEPDPFSSDAEDEPDERTRLEAYFMQSLEVDLLLRACPDEEDTIHQIVNLLVDTCSSKRRMLRVVGDDKPAEVVRSRFMKLNADHIRFVLKCLAESTAPVRNMKQYSDNPNRDDIVISIYDTDFWLHADNSTFPAWDRGFVQQREHLRQFGAGIRGLFDFDGIQNTIQLQNNVNLFCIFVAVVVQKWLSAGIQIGLRNFGNNIAFEDCTVHGTILQNLCTAPLGQIADQSRIIKIELWGFYQTLQKVIGIGVQIEDDTQCFQNVQPIFCLLLIDVRILCNFGNIQHLGAARCNRCHETQKFQRIDGI